MAKHKARSKFLGPFRAPEKEAGAQERCSSHAWEAAIAAPAYSRLQLTNAGTRQQNLPSFFAESCLVSGDPHYYTFDKQTHHFMGNCTYTLSRLCERNSSRLPYFNVEASNEHRGGNTHVSYVESVDVDVLGIRVTLGKGGRVKVGGAGGGAFAATGGHEAAPLSPSLQPPRLTLSLSL